jgi:hypothetical protein
MKNAQKTVPHAQNYVHRSKKAQGAEQIQKLIRIYISADHKATANDSVRVFMNPES